MGVTYVAGHLSSAVTRVTILISLTFLKRNPTTGPSAVLDLAAGPSVPEDFAVFFGDRLHTREGNIRVTSKDDLKNRILKGITKINELVRPSNLSPLCSSGPSL